MRAVNPGYFRVACALALASWTGAAQGVPPSSRPDLPTIERLDQTLTRAAWQGAQAIGHVVRAQNPTQRLDPLVNGIGAPGDRLARGMVREGDTLLVGMPFDAVPAFGIIGGVQSGSAVVFGRSGNTWIPQATLLPDEGGTGDQTGLRVALFGDTAVLGAPRAAEQGQIDRGAVYVFQRTGSAWSQVVRLLASDGAASSGFGDAIALEGDTLIVGAPTHDIGADADAGQVYVFQRTAGVWSQVAILSAVGAASDDRYGSSVALSGGLLLVGAPLQEDAGSPTNAGVVHVYTGAAATWALQGALSAQMPESDARFGGALLLNSTRAIVGAPGNASGASGRGAARVYTRAGNTLTATQTLTASDGAADENFGSSFAIAGTRLVIGAPFRHAGEGGAYVFEDGGAGFAQTAVLAADDGGFSDRIGDAVVIDGSEILLGASLDQVANNVGQGSIKRFVQQAGNWTANGQLDLGTGVAFLLYGTAVALEQGTALVGAHLDDTVAGSDAGSVYVYRRGVSGWEFDTRLLATDAFSEDRFGIAVQLQSDLAYVGSYFNVVVGMINRGAVYVFSRGAGGWSQIEKLVTPGGSPNEFLGFSLDADGDTLLAGAPGDSAQGLNSGAAHVWRRVDGIFQYVTRLTDPSFPPEGFAGLRVSVSGDVALLGAPETRVGDNARQGAVHVFTRNGSGWTFTQTLVASDASANDLFGSAVDIQGDSVLIGAPGDTSTTAGSHGSMYVFTRSGNSFEQTSKVLPEPLVAGGAFGIAIARARDTVLVGASSTSGGAGLPGEGRVYELKRSGANFAQVRVLAPSTARDFQFFGRAIGYDGVHALIGAPNLYRDNPQEGAAYAFADDDALFFNGFE